MVENRRGIGLTEMGAKGKSEISPQWVVKHNHVEKPGESKEICLKMGEELEGMTEMGGRGRGGISLQWGVNLEKKEERGKGRGKNGRVWLNTDYYYWPAKN